MSLGQRMDELLSGDFAALCLEQKLRPVVGRVVFPPTFAPPRGQKGGRYIIDEVDGVRKVMLNTPGAEANHLEPLFASDARKHNKYASLVPQVWIHVGEQRRVNLLTVGHRASDALVRSSTGAADITKSYQAALGGDLSDLARLAPTSIAFGSWDSRFTGAKLGRLLTSTIEARGVHERTRAAQYFSPVRYVTEGLLTTKDGTQAQRSEAGFLDAPSGVQPGGVELDEHASEIMHTILINLVGLDALQSSANLSDAPLTRYILGLLLVAATAPRRINLRQGCLLVRDGGAAGWSAERFDGDRTVYDFDHDEVFSFAQSAARDFFGGPTPEDVDWHLQEGGAKRELQRYLGRKSKAEADQAEAADK